MIGLFFRYLEFRMHPRCFGSYTNTYYAVKRATRGIKNPLGCGDGCLSILLFLFFTWFFIYWMLLLFDVNSSTALWLSFIIYFIFLAIVYRVLHSEIPISNTNISIEDEITRREFFQQYEFRKYNPVNYPYVLGIAIGSKVYRYTANEIKNFWVDFDFDENKAVLHISNEKFPISKTPNNQKDIDFFIDFVMQCGGMDTRGKIPTEPPDRK